MTATMEGSCVTASTSSYGHLVITRGRSIGGGGKQLKPFQFLNEDVTGALGIQELYEKVKVHVLNDSVETFESRPVTVQIMPARDGTVDMLIEVDNADLHLSMVDLRTESLGWMCVRGINAGDSSEKRTHVIRTFLTRQPNIVARNSCCDIGQNLKCFWEVESCGMETNDVNILTESEKKALDLVSESLLYQNGRYQVTVPSKENKPKLLDNRCMATSRLRSTEKK